jgi:hypothetical protein
LPVSDFRYGYGGSENMASAQRLVRLGAGEGPGKFANIDDWADKSGFTDARRTFGCGLSRCRPAHVVASGLEARVPTVNQWLSWPTYKQMATSARADKQITRKESVRLLINKMRKLIS